MDFFKIKIAETVIGINARYPYAREYCKAYITDEAKTDFCVTADEDSIKSALEASHSTNFGFAETMALYGPISKQMVYRDSVVFHGASIEWKGRCFIFTAPSGTGKSTHIGLWAKYIGTDKVGIVNGDKPILTNRGGKTYVYGTPWSGKEMWQRNICVPLDSICIIKQAQKPSVREISLEEAVPKLIMQTFLPQESEGAGLALEILDRTVLSSKVYELSCDISEEAVKCSFEALTGESYDSVKLS